MKISTVGYSTKQGVKNIFRNKLFSLASVATMAACIFVFGLFFAIVMNFNYMVQKAEEGVAITVFFKEGTAQEQIDAIGADLKGQQGVLRVEYVSAEDAWAEFQDDYFAGNEDAAEGFADDNPLINSNHYEVYMSDVSKQQDIVEHAQSLEGVGNVNKSDVVAKTLTKLNSLIWYVSIAIIAILLAVSVFLISNTVTMGVTVRREEIAIMKYIGANNYMVQKAEEGVAITVFFKEGTAQEQIDAIGADLKGQQGVLRVEYVSAEDAWAEFQDDYFAGNEDAAEGFADDNPLINSNHYEVYMSDVSKQQDIVEHAQSLEGVGNVNKSDVVAKTLTKLNSLIWYVSIAIIAILLAVSVFLISNTVTMGVTVRREEIAIMKYIGAKDGFVRAPFVIEGLVIGIVGAIIPLILLYFMYNKAVEYIMMKFSLLNNIIDFLPVMDVYKTLLPVGLALGAGIGFLGSFITIRKHLHA